MDSTRMATERAFINAPSYTNVHHPDYYDEHGNYTGRAMWKALMHDQADLTIRTLADEVSANTARLVDTVEAVGYYQDQLERRKQGERFTSLTLKETKGQLASCIAMQTRLETEKTMLSHLAQRMGLTDRVYTMAGQLDWARREDDQAWHDEMKARSQADKVAGPPNNTPDRAAAWKAAYDAYWKEHYILTEAGRWIRKHDEQAAS